MLVAALAGIAVAAALVAVAWKWGGNEPDRIANLGTTQAQPSAPAGGAGARCVPPRSGTWIAFELAGVRTGSRVTVYRGASTAGKLLFDGTVEPGRKLVWTGGNIWVEATIPENLVARINCRRVALPPGEQQFVASRVGVRPAAG